MIILYITIYTKVNHGIRNVKMVSQNGVYLNMSQPIQKIAYDMGKWSLMYKIVWHRRRETKKNEGFDTEITMSEIKIRAVYASLSATASPSLSAIVNRIELVRLPFKACAWHGRGINGRY